MKTDSKQGKRRLCFAAIVKALKKDLDVAQEEHDSRIMSICITLGHKTYTSNILILQGSPIGKDAWS